MSYFDDDGNEVKIEELPKPLLCLSCVKDDDPDEEEHILCNLNRLDQYLKDSARFEHAEFQCCEYKRRTVH